MAESDGRFDVRLGHCLPQRTSNALLGHDIRAVCSCCDTVVLLPFVEIHCCFGKIDAFITSIVALATDSKDAHRTPTTLGDNTSHREPGVV